MPQAVKLTENNIMLIAVKTDQSSADVRALYEDLANSGVDEYIIFDYETLGGYAPWLAMNEKLFHERFRFPYGELPNKFMPVTSI